MSEKQLHEPTQAAEAARVGFAVRPCEMEARSVPQHRTTVNLVAGMLIWVSDPHLATPNIRSWSMCIGGGSGGKSQRLTPGELDRTRRWGSCPAELVGRTEGNDPRTRTVEKSDHLVVALKRSNARGAKGVTC